MGASDGDGQTRNLQHEVEETKETEQINKD
jgi:hypothetical protein